MAKKISLELRPKLKTDLKQHQLLMMQPKMQQAIALLQAPILELSTLIEQELERNPLLESEELFSEEEQQEISPEREVTIDDNDFENLKDLDEEYLNHFMESGSFVPRNRDKDGDKLWETTIPAHDTLFQKLMKQAFETFDQPEQIEMATAIVGNFDEKGYLKTSIEEIAMTSNWDLQLLKKILKRIQTFEPYGVGGNNLRETLLIQFRCLGKKESLAYEIVKNHYDDLIHNKIPKISRALKCSYETVQKAIREISHLNLHPGLQLSQDEFASIVPDVVIREEDGHFLVEINEENVPSIHLNSKYLRLFNAENATLEVKECIKKYYQSAKWFVKNLYHRNETLTRIMYFLLKKQQQFFAQSDGNLVPLNMKEVAQELEVHESTIARAVSNKYVQTTRGTIPLRFFFTNALISEEGKEVSSETVKIVLKEIIASENKHKPFSDQALSDQLRERGIHCARRTVAKYRKLFDIGKAVQRRKFSSS